MNSFWDTAKKVLIEALDYPEFARAEYFSNSQKSSGWGKYVFYNSLYQCYHSYQAKIKANGQIDLAQETSGKQTGFLTKEVLSNLRDDIEKANVWHLEPKELNVFELLTITESSLLFIRQQFNIQTGKIKPSIFDLKSKDGQPFIYKYTVYGTLPIFDFFLFRDAVRKLLFETTNGDLLKKIVRPLYDYAKYSIDLWNNQLFEIEQAINEKNEGLIFNNHVRFNERTKSFTRLLAGYRDNVSKRQESYSNVDFARFAARASYLFGYEVLGIEEPEITIPEKDEVRGIKHLISKELEKIDINLGWKYSFSNENDFNSFLDLLSNYFEQKPYSLVQKKIKLKRGCITRFAKAIGSIYKDFISDNMPLKKNLEFLKLLRVLDLFEKQTDDQIYQALTR